MKNLSPKEVLELVGKVLKGKNLPFIGGFNPKSSVKYVAGLTTAIASRTGQLVLPSQATDFGITNIQQAKLSYPFVVTGISAKFDTTTGVGVTAKTAVFDDPAPAYIRNGELRVSQKGELINIPVSAIANSNSPTSVNDDVYPVVPFVIREDEVFEVIADLAGAPVANEAFRFELHGYELRPDKTV